MKDMNAIVRHTDRVKNLSFCDIDFYDWQKCVLDK